MAPGIPISLRTSRLVRLLGTIAVGALACSPPDSRFFEPAELRPSFEVSSDSTECHVAFTSQGVDANCPWSGSVSPAIVLQPALSGTWEVVFDEPMLNFAAQWFLSSGPNHTADYVHPFATVTAYDANGAVIAVIPVDGNSATCGLPYCWTQIDAPTRVIKRARFETGNLVNITELIGQATYSVDSLILSVNKKTVAPGDSFAFTAQGVPSSVPFQVTTWRWIADSGSSSTSCAPDPSCTYKAPVSGIMYCDATVGSTARTKSIRVTVVACPTNDSLMDDPKVRHAMVAGMDASNPTAMPEHLRQEHSGYIWRMPDGTMIATDNTAPGATACHADPIPISPSIKPDSAAIAVGTWHTHPHASGDNVYGCRGNSPSGLPWAQYPGQTNNFGALLPVGTAGGNKNGGGSPADWGINDGFPRYIINNDGNIFRLVPTPKSQWSKNKPLTSWTAPACSWRNAI